jgi:hypothetical protein
MSQSRRRQICPRRGRVAYSTSTSAVAASLLQHFTVMSRCPANRRRPWSHGAAYGLACTSVQIVRRPNCTQRRPRRALRDRWRYARDAMVPTSQYPDSMLNLDAIVQTCIDVWSSEPEPSISDRTVPARRRQIPLRSETQRRWLGLRGQSGSCGSSSFSLSTPGRRQGSISPRADGRFGAIDLADCGPLRPAP